jgi:hypothetical protein
MRLPRYQYVEITNAVRAELLSRLDREVPAFVPPTCTCDEVQERMADHAAEEEML